MIEKGTAVGCPFEIIKKACHCEADSPYQGEMSRRDKRDRASCQLRSNFAEILSQNGENCKI